MAKGKDKGTGFEAAGRTGPTGANYLLAVAINDYQHHPKLSNCVRDAEQLVRVLQEKYGFQPDHTVTLFDQEATSANLYTHLVELSQKVRPRDNVVIYFSGHGFYDRSDRTGHLVTVEAPAGAVWHYFSNANLVNRIRAINSFHTFLIVDSCFSGSLFASKDVGATALAEVVEGLPSRWALAAGQIERVEDGLHGDHSPFAKALLSYLEANAQPLVPASELIQHVKRVTPHNARQTPVGGVLFKTGDVGGEFVFHLNEKEFYRASEENAARPENDAASHLQRPLIQSPNWMKYVLLIGFIVIAIFSIRNQFKPVEKNVPATDVIQNPSLVAEKPATDVIQNPSQVVEKPAMVLITEGELYMGDTFGDGEGDEKPSRLSLKIDSYYIGAYEVTFREFDAFCEASDLINKPDDAGWRRGSRPVINVSWLDAIKYCNWLSEQHGYQKVYTISGSTVTANWNANGYRLPTEAEWEFAARERGKKVRFGNGKDIAIPEEINFDGSHQKKESYSKGGAYREKTTEVGYFAPNDLGLYDMSGNVWEWCWDWYGNYLDFPQDNLHGPENGTVRIVRGGSWENGPKDARCTNRGYEKQTQRFETVGFRLARATERF